MTSKEIEIEALCEKLSHEFSIGKDAVLKMYQGGLLNLNSIETPKSDKTVVAKLDSACLAKLTVPDLKKLCVDRKISVSGKKSEIIERIEKHDSGTATKSEKPKEKEKEKDEIIVSKKTRSKKPDQVVDGGDPGPSTKKKPVPKTKVVKNSTIVDRLEMQKVDLSIKRNGHGNYEHQETSLVLDPENNVVIGKQLPDGSIGQLEIDDYETCKKFKFHYKIPENLNTADDVHSRDGEVPFQDEDNSLDDGNLLEEASGSELEEEGDGSDLDDHNT